MNISVEKLKKAYNLTIEECYTLIDTLPAVDAHGVFVEGSTVNTRIAEGLSTFYVKKVDKNTLKGFVLGLNAAVNHERETDRIIPSFRFSDSDESLAHLLQNLFICLLQIDRDEAIKYFIRQSYPLANEVKGISHELVAQHKNIAASSLTPVNIPTSLWAGKSALSAAAALQEAEYGEEVIAYILVKKMNAPLTEAGRILYQNGGREREDKTCRNKAETLLTKASQLYDIKTEN